jgi:hypothetical protein
MEISNGFLKQLKTFSKYKTNKMKAAKNSLPGS